MSDDLIRREDALRVTLAYSSSYSAEQAETAIRALPAVQPDAREAALREAADSLLECSVWCDSQERTDDGWRNGVTDARKHHMARILALIDKPAHVNETPKSEHDAANVLTPAKGDTHD